MHDFKQLLVWQRSMELVADLYRVVRCFPDEERYGLTSQLKRCAVSIPSNIAEGAGYKSKKKFKQFLQISIGSTYEFETQIILSRDLGMINHDNFDRLNEQLDIIQKMLNKFYHSMDEGK